MNIEEKLTKDTSIFGEEVVKNCVLRTFKQRLWGAWKVLMGEAGIVFIHLDRKKFLKK